MAIWRPEHDEELIGVRWGERPSEHLPPQHKSLARKMHLHGTEVKRIKWHGVSATIG
jgi:hypothetical protein